MAETIYVLCAVASVACAIMLHRGYRATRTKLLFWSSLCFAGLALANLALCVDRVLMPTMDLTLLRTSLSLAAMVTLVYGLVCETR